jgi:hypothetical protein
MSYWKVKRLILMKFLSANKLIIEFWNVLALFNTNYVSKIEIIHLRVVKVESKTTSRTTATAKKARISKFSCVLLYLEQRNLL